MENFKNGAFCLKQTRLTNRQCGIKCLLIKLFETLSSCVKLTLLPGIKIVNNVIPLLPLTFPSQNMYTNE